MKRRRGVVVFLSIWLWAPNSWCFLSSQPQNSIRYSPTSTRVSYLVLHNNENSVLPSQSALDSKTRQLLKRDEIGAWTEDMFQDVLDTMGLWSRRPNRRTCDTLERLLRRVVEEKLVGNPNATSLDMMMTPMYNTVIQSWSKSGEKGAAQRAEEIFDNMQFAYEEGDLSLKPDINSFNAVLNAYAESKQKDSPLQAMRVLQKLHDLIASKKTDIIPNMESYACLLRAYAGVGGKDAPARVLKLLNRME